MWKPAVYVTDAAAREWLREWGGMAITQSTLTSSHLEMQYGKELRALEEIRSMTSVDLSK